MTVAETGSPISLTYSAQLDSPVEGLGWVADLAEGYEWETDLGRRLAARHPLPPLGAPRGHRRGRRHHPVERAPPDQPGQARAGPGRRQHRGAQAGAGHALVRHRARPADRRGDRHPARCGEHRARRRTMPSGPGCPTDPRVDQVSFTGSTATGKKIMARGGRLAEEGLPRARRQVGVRDPRRRRPAGRLRHRRLHRVHPRRAGLRHHHPAAGPAPPVRRGGRVDGQGAGQAAGRRPHRPRHHLRSAHQRPPAPAGRGVHRPGRRGARHRRDRRRPAGRAGPGLLRGADADRGGRQRLTGGPRGDLRSGPGGDPPRRGRRRRGPGQRLGLRAVGLGVVGGPGPGRRRVPPDPHRDHRDQRRPVVQPRRPFGGYKQSGIGRESGVAGFEEYLETKSMAEPA